MSEKVLRAAFGRTGLAISPLLKTGQLSPGKYWKARNWKEREMSLPDCRLDTYLQEARPNQSFAFRSSSPLQCAAFAPLWAPLHDPGLALHCHPFWLSSEPDLEPHNYKVSAVCLCKTFPVFLGFFLCSFTLLPRARKHQEFNLSIYPENPALTKTVDVAVS